MLLLNKLSQGHFYFGEDAKVDSITNGVCHYLYDFWNSLFMADDPVSGYVMRTPPIIIVTDR